MSSRATAAITPPQLVSLDQWVSSFEAANALSLESDTTCSICQYAVSDVTRTGRVVSLPCNEGHVFHEQCIKSWFLYSLRGHSPVTGGVTAANPGDLPMEEECITARCPICKKLLCSDTTPIVVKTADEMRRIETVQRLMQEHAAMKRDFGAFDSRHPPTAPMWITVEWQASQRHAPPVEQPYCAYGSQSQYSDYRQSPSRLRPNADLGRFTSASGEQPYFPHSPNGSVSSTASKKEAP